MIFRRQYTLISLACLFFLVLSANIYFIYIIVEDRFPSTKTENKPESHIIVETRHSSKNKLYHPSTKKSSKTIYHSNATKSATHKIYHALGKLPASFKVIRKESKLILNQLLDNIKNDDQISTKYWTIAKKWVNSQELHPASAPDLGNVLRTLCSTKIIKAENAHRGTQLKLLLTLEGEQKAIFKPQWYPRNEVIEGPVYAGKDRHNAEVAAFHLSGLLGFHRSPLTVGRKINLRREIMPVASQALLDTFFQEGNNTCFFGVCHYCSPQDPVCAKQDLMEGALILWLPEELKLKKYRNPWQRTYKTDSTARWEMDEHYCDKVKATRIYNPESNSRLLDLVDTSIFDFLIDNGDRHHYEVFENFSQSAVLLLDNGKSFGNPSADHIDILAPLYQCCIIRKQTWTRLMQLSGNILGTSLEALLESSHITPVLTDAHFEALDRRLLKVYASVLTCIFEHGKQNVFFEDPR